LINAIVLSTPFRFQAGAVPDAEATLSAHNMKEHRRTP
jgi:hypothetical protein